MGEPPFDLKEQILERELIAGPFVDGEVRTKYGFSYDLGGTAALHVEALRWELDGQGESTGQAIDVETFDVPLRYWPTRAALLSDTELLIGGKDSSGKTLLEHMSFDAPEIAMENGQVVLRAGELSSTRVVYSEAEVGRDMVSGLMVYRGTPYLAALVQFYDSRDVYLVNVDNPGPLTLLASPTAPPSGSPALHAPKLEEYYLISGYRQHVEDGHVYCFWKNAGADDLPDDLDAPYSVILFDSDRDGDLDGYFLGSEKELLQRHYDDPSSWVD